MARALRIPVAGGVYHVLARQRGQSIFIDRDEAIATAYLDHGYRIREIAEALGCHYATVGRRLRAFEAREGSGRRPSR